MARPLSRLPCTVTVNVLPTFLIPSISTQPLLRQLPCSFPYAKAGYHKTADRNRKRGVSALRRTGPKYPLSVSKLPLPQPVLEPEKHSKIEVDENHGLWGFFDKSRKSMLPPEEMAAHGRYIIRAFGGTVVIDGTIRSALVGRRVAKQVI